METPRKRQRKSWACLECRRRKLQCDRSRPCCKRCSIAGRASTCQYAETAHVSEVTEATPSHGSAPPVSETIHETVVPRITSAALQTASSPGIELLAQLQKKVKSLETIISSQNLTQSRSVPPDVFLGPWTDVPIDFRGSSFMTNFRGATFTGTLAERIPGLNAFTEDALAASATFEQIRTAVQYQSDPPAPPPQLSAENPTTAGLLFMMPAKVESDRCVSTYFDTMDHVFHVIHRPTFESDYARFWLDRDAFDPEFVVLILLMLAITYCATARTQNLQDLSADVPRQRAKSYVDTCEAWLQARVQPLYSLRSFQIQFLLLFSKQLIGRRYKRIWTHAGAWVRTCMCRGLHRDPGALGSDTSRLDKEMRKRLWAAAAEFEMQAAFEHGMCAMSWPAQSDTAPPLNVKDEHLEHQTVDQTAHAYTAVSFLSVAGESLRFRHELNNALNSINDIMTSEQTRSYADRISEYVHAIPQWNGSNPKVMKALLSITLEQYALPLFEQRMRHSDSAYEKQYLRVSIMETALRIIDYHKAAIAAGSQIIELMYSDHLRVALTMCTAYVSADPQSNAFLNSVGADIHGVMDELITIAGDKVRHFGGNRRQFLLLCSACGLMRTSKDPVGRPDYIQQTVNHFTGAVQDLLQQPHATYPPGTETVEGQFSAASNTLLPPINDDLWDWALEEWSFGGPLAR